MRKQKLAALILLIFSVASLGVGVWQAYEIYHLYYGYHQTAGKVLATGVEEYQQFIGGDETGVLQTFYRPAIAYEYFIEGQRFVGQRYSTVKEGGERAWAESIIKSYPVGSEVQVFYDSRDSQTAVLHKEVTWKNWRVALLIILPSGVLCVYSGFRLRRLMEKNLNLFLPAASRKAFRAE
jgi:hypothetical protein